MSQNTFNITIKLVCKNEDDSIDGGKDPTNEKCNDNSGVGDNAVVLYCCNVEEPEQRQ